MTALLIITSLAIGVPLTVQTIVYVEARGWRSLWRKLWDFGSLTLIVIVFVLGFIGWCVMALHGM